jgi:hypothetical protein
MIDKNNEKRKLGFETAGINIIIMYYHIHLGYEGRCVYL